MVIRVIRPFTGVWGKPPAVLRRGRSPLSKNFTVVEKSITAPCNLQLIHKNASYDHEYDEHLASDFFLDSFTEGLLPAGMKDRYKVSLAAIHPRPFTLAFH